MRAFFKSGSVTEITKQVNSYKSETYSLSMTDSDYIYLSFDFPTNHFFVKMGSVVNTVNSNMSIDYWTGQGWEPVVHKNDYTEALSSSGMVEFTPNRQSSWNIGSTNSSGSNITGLESITVYDQYWVRISFSADLDPSINLNYIGNVFSSDEDLFSEFPVFNDSNFLTGFETGKTTWEEQHVKAADLIIQDLKRKNVIVGKEQLLDISILAPASVCKVAEIIFNAFGKDYVEQLNRAKAEYATRIDLSKFLVDVTNDGIKDLGENTVSQGWLSR